MDAGTAFKPAGPTVAILGSNAAPSAFYMNMTGDWALIAFNRSTTVDAYLAYGPTSAAVASASVPLVSAPAPADTPNPQNLLALPRGTIQTFTFSGPTFLGGITATGNATIDITPGALGGV